MISRCGDVKAASRKHALAPSTDELSGCGIAFDVQEGQPFLKLLHVGLRSIIKCHNEGHGAGDTHCLYRTKSTSTPYRLVRWKSTPSLWGHK